MEYFKMVALRAYQVLLELARRGTAWMPRVGGGQEALSTDSRQNRGAQIERQSSRLFFGYFLKAD